MSPSVGKRTASALRALAMGDALSWSSTILRTDRLPPWLSRIRREIEADLTKQGLTSVPKPFSLNQTPEALLPAPGDTTEWAAWTVKLLIEHEGTLTAERLQTAWDGLARSGEGIRGRISVQAALRNLRSGISAPQCGRFNPHYFDDGALPRAAMIGLAQTGNPALAASMTGLDAAFTQYEDGLWSAVALATLFSLAPTDRPGSELLDKALAELPPDSLAARTTREAVKGVDALDGGITDTALFLNTHICNHIYSYGNIASEIVACLMAILKVSAGDPDRILACVGLVSPASGSLLALGCALAAALDHIPSRTDDGCPLQLARLHGASIPALKDQDLNALADHFGDLVESRYQRLRNSGS